MAKIVRATVVSFLFAGGMAFMPVQADASAATPPQVTSSALEDVRLPLGLHGSHPRPQCRRRRRPAIRSIRGPEKVTEAKDTRVEYAPYVIAAVIVVVIVASVIFWRGRESFASEEIRLKLRDALRLAEAHGKARSGWSLPEPLAVANNSEYNKHADQFALSKCGRNRRR